MIVRVFATAIVVATTLAQSPRVDQLTPAGAQRGSEVTVEFAGQRLADPQELWFEDAGIDVVEVTAGKKPETCTAKLRVRPECELGAHALRVRTKQGLTNLLLFHVGALPEVAEKRDANAPMRVELGTTVNGSLGNEDVDRYEVEVVAGTLVKCELQGVRLGSKLLDLVLAVTDPDGKEIARSDDTTFGIRDPLLAFAAATSGTFTLTVRTAFADTSNAGNYRLHVGTFPRPTGCLPCGGAPGEALDVRLLGDAALAGTTMHVVLPNGGDDVFRWFPEVGGVPSPTPLLLRVGGPPNRAPSVDDGGTAWVEWPASVGGVVAKPDEAVAFRWHAKKGVELEFRCIARTLRSPLDAVLFVRDAKNAVVANNDDAQGLDPVLRFTAPADGDYTIEVRDALRRGSADRFFRLEGAPRADAPSLRMVVGRREEASVVVPRGGNAAAVLQWSAFEPKDLALVATTVPAGVTVHFGAAVPGTNSLPVVWTAAADAPLAASAMDFTWNGSDGKAARAAGYTQSVPMVYTRNDQPLTNRVQRTLPVAVVDAAPFAIQVTPPTAPIVRGAPLVLNVHVPRSSGFAEKVALRVPWTPPGVSGGQASVEAKAEDGTVSLSADGKAATGRFTIVVVGEARVRGGSVVVSSDFVELQVDEPWLTASCADVRTEAGRDVELEITVAKKRDVPAAGRVHLLGLPRGVSADDVTVGVDGGAVRVPVRIGADAAIGRHRSVIAQILVPTVVAKDGETPPMAEHRFPLGELRIDAPERTAASGVR